jgi:hypothetical protein
VLVSPRKTAGPNLSQRWQVLAKRLDQGPCSQDDIGCSESMLYYVETAVEKWGDLERLSSLEEYAVTREIRKMVGRWPEGLEDVGAKEIEPKEIEPKEIEPKEIEPKEIEPIRVPYAKSMR